MRFIKKQLYRCGAYKVSTNLATPLFPPPSSTQTSKTGAAATREWPTDCHNQQPSDRRYSEMRRRVRTKHSIRPVTLCLTLIFETRDNGKKSTQLTGLIKIYHHQNPTE